MSEVTVLRNKIKKFVDMASPKELEMAYHLFNASKKMTGGMKYLKNSKMQ